MMILVNNIWFSFQPKSGAEMGPNLLRKHGLVERLNNFGCDVKDHGNVEIDDDSFNNDVDGNVKNPRTVAAVSKKVGF